ncbi:uncharacterized protein L969DRAFT_14723 [Mixia osmundae IAM 14324]|uniref:Chromatin modification-related protein EAF7 n=1 Tax=Mixia osmundae (strain CBS 9802 / IAM 14324 / JCM 22182 / KY 12970) TaxID=764103 RepID=G7E300_MIXOS|nr:uncharacterized protein L969DRAFT_14723 [Mixia osmundae IAM 14324]KEI42530.1 hypothetical protein L969DRAFT_14723 [Mixia osmundae IAM 14324]GAA97181.1 hypothetical protein E5Q_03857 [Mixia osmundae IAM 14324]
MTDLTPFSSSEDQLELLRAIVKFRPVGTNRHFAVLAIQLYLSEQLSRPIKTADVWHSLKQLYDLDALNEMDDEGDSSDVEPEDFDDKIDMLEDGYRDEMERRRLGSSPAPSEPRESDRSLASLSFRKKRGVAHTRSESPAVLTDDGEEGTAETGGTEEEDGSGEEEDDYEESASGTSRKRKARSKSASASGRGTSTGKVKKAARPRVRSSKSARTRT